MDVTLVVVPQCPHHASAAALLNQALTDIGAVDATVRTITVLDSDMADQLQFPGSPTFMVNGADVLPGLGPSGVSCRLYQTPDGTVGLPTLVALSQGLKRALDAARH